MGKINVIWKSYHKPEIIDRGYWDQGILEDTFAKDEFEHHTSMHAVPNGEGAIVVINGRTHVDDIALINKDLANLAWVLLIITGDEEGLFPWQEIRHPMLRTWVQLPRMNKHNDVSFKLPNGYRAGTPALLKDIGYWQKDIDFSFIGQVNHPRREQCVEAAETIDNQYESYIETTDAFGKEALAQREYLGILARSKIVLCPSGIETPDTFRLYEALEAGCVPVVDAFATNNQDWGFWFYLFGEQPPFPIIPYWDELPNLMPTLLKEYPENANRCFAWWQQYKRKIYNKLMSDLKEINR